MISLNTYSFALRMGLIQSNKKIEWKFNDFIKYTIRNSIKRIEFPIDYFSKKENQNYEYFFKILKKKKIYSIIDLENFSIVSIKKLLKLSNKYNFEFIRVKMSNFFGGNRYLDNNFENKKKNFLKRLQKCSLLIKDSKLKILIENHQDLNSNEIINIIMKCKYKNIGINWDIGNSLPTCETPMTFFKNAKKYIYNVHCKDYNIILSDKGYFLKRAILGKGIINFKLFASYFKKKKINISVEIGAHITRHSHLFHKNFNNKYNIPLNKLNIFKKYIFKNAINENIFTNWELYKNVKKSTIEENLEFKESLKYLKNI